MLLSQCLVLNLGEMCEDESILDLARRINASSNEKSIVLLIDSVGGEVDTSHAVIGAVTGRKNVTAIVTGVCNSMAIAVFASCPQRLALPHATFFFHSRHWKMSLPYLALEDETWVRTKTAELLDAHRHYEEIIASAMTNKDHDFIRELCRNKRTLTAPEAAELGLVQRIIDLPIE